MKFCIVCGHVKDKVKTGWYDSATGELATTLECINPVCESGCINAGGGHVWKWWQTRCRRCGYRASDNYM